MRESHEERPRPEGCCGACPPIVGGGYDCTCKGNPRCRVRAKWDPDSLEQDGEE